MRKGIVLAGDAQAAETWQAAAERAGLDAVVAPADLLPQSIRDTAVANQAHGIYAVTPDAYVPAIQAAQALNRPAPAAEWLTPDAAIHLRMAWSDAGLPVNAWQTAKDEQEAHDAAESLGLPVWLRESDLFDGAVRYRVDAPDELPLGLKRARHASPDRPVLIEAAAPGAWCRLFGFKVGREFRPFEIVSEQHDEAPFLVPCGLALPAAITSAQYKQIVDIARKATGPLPSGYGLVSLGFLIDGHAVRLAGLQVHTQIPQAAAHIFEQAFGMDLYADALRVAVGDIPEAAGNRYLGAALRWIQTTSGVFEGVQGQAAAEAVPHVREVRLNAAPGSVIGHVTSDATRAAVGHVLAVAPTRAGAIEAVEAARTKLEISVQPVAS